MTRVLHLVHWLVRGGIETWLLNMLRTIPRSECQMDICCKGPSTGELAPVAEQLGARVFHCPLGPTHLPFARQLGRILRDGDYQVLHSHLELYSGFPVWVAHRLGIPVITSFHNTHFPPQAGWSQRFLLQQLRRAYGAVSISYALRHSTLVTGCSRAVLEQLDPHGRKIPAQRSRVLYYGVPFAELATAAERDAFRASLGWPADTPLILHVGRFVEQKNHRGLLAVFQRVLQGIPGAKLLLVGDGMLRPDVEKAVTAGGLAEHVRLLGSRSDVSALMNKCDVFLFPSLHEGLGLVAVEANAAGLPVVGSRIAGLTEAVQDGTTAILHDAADVEGMARSVVELLTDPPFAQRLANAGRSWARDQFSIEAGARRLLDTYNLLTPQASASKRVPQLLGGRV